MAGSRKGPFLLRRDMAAGQKPLETGACVPYTGIYRILHAQHRLPGEVMLLEDERFPRCARCADPVAFELIRVIDDLPRDSVCKVYELPVIDEGAANDAAKAAS